MNILELYKQKLLANKFNETTLKGYIKYNDFGFDIRVVDNVVYANGLPFNDFLNECLCDNDENIELKKLVDNWLANL